MMRIAVPSWVAVERFEEKSPIVVPPATVVSGPNGCGEEHSGEQRWMCTRRLFHGGRHAAALHTGEVLAVWP